MTARVSPGTSGESADYIHTCIIYSHTVHTYTLLVFANFLLNSFMLPYIYALRINNCPGYIRLTHTEKSFYCPRSSCIVVIDII